MSHPTFWFEEVRRRVGAMADGSLVDAGVSNSGVTFYKQHSQEEIGLISWDEIWMALKADMNRSRANYLKMAEAFERHTEREVDCPACRELDRIIAEDLHGPINESAPLRIVPAEDDGEVSR